MDFIGFQIFFKMLSIINLVFFYGCRQFCDWKERERIGVSTSRRIIIP